MKTILVTDKPEDWAFASKFATIVPAMEYLTETYDNEKSPMRIINLCNSYQYQSFGYYVSLIATARGHKVLPSVMAIQDVKNLSLLDSLSESITEEIQKELASIKSEEFVLSVYFGKNVAKRYNNLARKLHSLFPLPIFRVHFIHKKKWRIQKVCPIEIAEIPEMHLASLEESAKEYFEKKRFYLQRKKSYFYDMAILINPEEINKPSNEIAIEKFIEAAEELDINAQLIEKEEIRFIAEYDALFIRETTSVNHHTYRISRRAASEGLIVMDSPNAIVKCSNKVYLAELLRKHAVKTPLTHILNKQNYKELAKTIDFPCVLKLPDSAFSKGVVKINNLLELEENLKEFFKQSDLIVVQTFMPSEYDWRIGVLDNEALFACRYFMAKGHWQIYDWQSEEPEGEFETIPLSEVPPFVLQTAVKAARLIGDELYGVDLKQIGDEAYVIEINDNPNLDHGVEDVVLKDELYLKVMQSFLKRLKKSYGQN